MEVRAAQATSYRAWLAAGGDPTQPGKVLDYPEPGFYRLRQARRGPWVPALIWRPCPMIIPIRFEETPAPEDWCRYTERPRLLQATIADQAADPLEVWSRGERIGPREYHHRLALAEWAKTHAPGQPEANPRKRVDLTGQPSLF
jgi:hypothetical protein